ncbi:hypothetical protein [Thermophilibacter mediterraneus]|uniref:MuF-C-terminal domain-containing protein n=1 Tax=Thermophilibacter mediterraneus TaxID=1871031 RepID=UPI0023549605|nr:hypothetical protein [Thermophilibacter mediterraneus]
MESVPRPSELDDGELEMLGSSCKDYLRFGRLVDAVVSGRLPDERNLLVRQNTPRALLELGFPDLPWVMTRKHVEQVLSPKIFGAVHGHGLTRYSLKRLPELMEWPAAVISSPTRGIVCVLAERDPEGLPLVMPCDPDVTDRSATLRGDVNFVLSVYGSVGLGARLNRASREGRLMALDLEALGSLIPEHELKELARAEAARSSETIERRNEPLRAIASRAPSLLDGGTRNRGEATHEVSPRR